MLAIQRKITPYNFSAMNSKKNEYIVIHYTGAVGTAKNNVDYFAREKLQSSATYFVDNTSIWQCVEDKDRAWHCGGGLQGSNGHSFYKICTNSNSIGIEMCCKKDTSGNLTIEKATADNTIDLVRYLMKKYNIPIGRVIRHYDVTGKNCPAPYVNESAWAAFKNKIVEEEQPMTNEERTKFNELVNAVSTLATKVDNLTKTVDKLSNPMIYAWVDDNMPEWARDTVTKLMQKGILKGDDEGKLNLTYDMLRTFVILDRAGAFDK